MEVTDLLEFGPFRADVRRRTLVRGGELVPLPPKAFDVLVALLQRRGETVSKDDLMKAVWPDTFVEEGNLAQMIFLLRKALGDSDGGQPFIVTVPRQGYRFVGHLANVAIGDSSPGAPAEQPASAPVIAVRPYVLPWVVAGTLAVIAAGASWFAWRAAQPAPALHPVPVTSYPGSESSPSLSPDGKYVAFVWGGERDDN